MTTATNFAERYLNNGWVYDFNLTPADVPNFEAAGAQGINCYLLARIAIQDFYGVSLPDQLRCTEMFYDTSYLERTPYDASRLRSFDLVWFGRAGAEQRVDSFVPDYDSEGNLRNWPESPTSHVALATGEWHEGEPLLLHAVQRENVTVWPLSRFKRFARYATLQGMSRVKHHP